MAHLAWDSLFVDSEKGSVCVSVYVHAVEERQTDKANVIKC